MQVGGTNPSMMKPPELPSTSMERIKSVEVALAVELEVDMDILPSTILGVSGKGLGNVEPGPLAERTLSTRCVSSDSAWRSSDYRPSR